MNNFTRPGVATIAGLLVILLVLLLSGCASSPPCPAGTYLTDKMECVAP